MRNWLYVSVAVLLLSALGTSTISTAHAAGNNWDKEWQKSDAYRGQKLPSWHKKGDVPANPADAKNVRGEGWKARYLLIPALRVVMSRSGVICNAWCEGTLSTIDFVDSVYGVYSAAPYVYAVLKYSSQQSGRGLSYATTEFARYMSLNGYLSPATANYYINYVR